MHGVQVFFTNLFFPVCFLALAFLMTEFCTRRLKLKFASVILQIQIIVLRVNGRNKLKLLPVLLENSECYQFCQMVQCIFLFLVTVVWGLLTHATNIHVKKIYTISFRVKSRRVTSYKTAGKRVLTTYKTRLAF